MDALVFRLMSELQMMPHYDGFGWWWLMKQRITLWGRRGGILVILSKKKIIWTILINHASLNCPDNALIVRVFILLFCETLTIITPSVPIVPTVPRTYRKYYNFTCNPFCFFMSIFIGWLIPIINADLRTILFL